MTRALLMIKISKIIGSTSQFFEEKKLFKNVAVAQWVRAFAPQAEGWVFESQPRQT